MPRAKYEHVDELTRYLDQLESNEEGAVVLLNTFVVDPADADEMIETWRLDSEVMKRQPGYISAQLHRGIAGSRAFVNYAVWESVAHLRAAFNNPEFRAVIERTPASAVARPHVFKKVAVPNVCAG